jgi:hydrogenase expression/formation protein HypC
MCIGGTGRLVETWDEGGMPMGRVRVGSADGGEEVVCLMYVPGAEAGQDVVVHLGFAVEVLDATTIARS